MTTEEKAKAYDAALETAKQVISDNCTEVEKICLECVFPQLRENEDERIRKAILSALRGGIDTEKYLEKHGTNYGEVEDWLEKQKEQKPVEWSEAEEKIRLKLRNDGFEAGKESALKQFSDILEKWEEHAIRGMKKGASAYHQGKIALICDLRDWIKVQIKE